MPEARVFLKENRRVNRQSFVIVVLALASLGACYYAWHRSFLPHSAISYWLVLLFLITFLIGFAYWRISALRSKAKLVSRAESLYEGFAFSTSLIVFLAVSIFMVVLSLVDFMTLLQIGEDTALVLVSLAFLWFFGAAYVCILILSSKIELEENGIVLRQSLLRSTPPRFIMFDDLDFIRLDGHRLVLGIKKPHFDETIIVRNPDRLGPLVEKLTDPRSTASWEHKRVNDTGPFSSDE